jgi:hypothetical protein
MISFKGSANKVSTLKTLFITFADGNLEYLKAAKRLKEQAQSLGIFSKVIALDDDSFRKLDSDWNEIAQVLASLHLLPYYYLGAKAWVIKSALYDAYGNFDLIFYSDAGCELMNNFWAKKELLNLLQLANSYGGIAEQLSYPEKLYSKQNLINYFNLTGKDLETGQVQATWSIWKNTEKSKDIVNTWVSISNPYLNYWHNPEGIEKLEQSNYFKEHRRDQSIFSILWKQNQYHVKSPYWEYGGKFGLIRGSAVPIHTTRNRTGISNIREINKNFLVGFIARLINMIAAKFRTIKRTIKRW